MTNLSRRDREAIFNKVCRLVETKHFNPKLNSVDWGSVVEDQRDRILQVQDAEEFEKEMHELVSQLKTSHTGFFHRSARRIPARFAVTGKEADRGAFKTPTLRNIAQTAPYMHDGSLATLEEVVEFYNRAGNQNPHLDSEIRPLGLTGEDKQALVVFLRSLSGTIREGISTRCAN